LIFAETPQSVEKLDFFFKDFIHGTTITGSWIHEVRKFAKSQLKAILYCSLFVWPVVVVVVVVVVVRRVTLCTDFY